MFRNLNKLSIGFIYSTGVGLIFVIFISLGIYSVSNVKKMVLLTDSLYKHPFAVANATRDIQTNIIAMHRSMKDVAMATSNDEIKQASNRVDLYEKETLMYFKTVLKLFLGDKTKIEDLLKEFKNWKVIRSKVIRLRLAGSDRKAAAITKNEGAKHVEKLVVDVRYLIEFANNKAEHFHKNTLITGSDFVNKSILLICIGLFISILLAVFAFKNIIRIINQTSRAAEWRLGFSKEVSGDLTTKDYAEKAIGYILKQLKGDIATYFTVDHERSGKMIPIASLGVTEPQKNLLHYNKGEGLIGVVAKSGKLALYENLPEGYLDIKSSVGKHPANHVLIVPVMHQQKIISVFEIGGIRSFAKSEIAHLENILDLVATNAGVASSRDEARYLFEQTTLQSKTLQIQQEELKTSNEELEEYTQMLKSQEEELRQSNSELEEQAEKLESEKDRLNQKTSQLRHAKLALEKKSDDLNKSSQYKSEFLANMSHELRTPLNSILVLSKVMEENDDDNLTKRQLRNLNIIHHSGSDLLTLINDILDISKIEAGEFDIDSEKILIRDLLDSIRDKMEPLAETKGIAFNIHFSEPLKKDFFSDQKFLDQILKNLLSNAVKFTEKGSVSLTVNSDERGVMMAVEDTGIGIAKEKHDLIFEPFKQADGATTRTYGGTGLGLSITKKLVHVLGGKIILESEKGKGSLFTIQFPYTNRVDNNVSTTQTDIKSQDNRKTLIETVEIEDDSNRLTPDDPVILIIEDDVDFANILVQFCHKKNFKGIIAANGVEGVKLANQLIPKGIILDLSLPGLNGQKVLEILKEDPKTRHIPVQIISGQDPSKNLVAMGAIGFLRKPFNQSQLEQVWNKISHLNTKGVKRLLIIEDNENQRTSIKECLESKIIEFLEVSTGGEAIAILNKETVDCIILDLDLPDMTGFQFLDHFQKQELPPVVVFTGKVLTKEEDHFLKRCSKSVIVKGAHSYERLIDDTSLFLHQVATELPKKKQTILKNLHDPNRILKEKKILIVDDDSRNLHALSEILERSSVNVIVANDGIDALEQLDKHKDIDLVLMDMMMPRMDGYQATREIRKKSPFAKLPVIALTAKTMKGEKEECLNAGCDDYLSKPIDIDRLLSILRVWLYRGRSF